MFINFVSYFLIIVLSLVEVHSQLCNTRTIVTRKVLVTYTELSRWRTKIAQKWVTKSEPKEIQTCCDGYSQKNFFSWVVCKPICKSNCENGYCEKPEVCGCNAGYTKRYNICVPVCKADCLHGTCLAPNTCLCHSGYNLVNGTCQPVCRYPCGNGTCVYPDLCYCFPGFQINYLKHYDHEVGPVCVPIYKDYSGINCVGCAKKQRFSRSNKDTTTTTTTTNPFIRMSTYNHYEYHTGDTTTTTKDPFITRTTYNNYKYHTEDTTTSTTTTPHFVSSSSSAVTVLDIDANNNMIQKSWMQQYAMYIWIPILLTLSTVLILLLVWQGVPMIIINFYKGVKNRRSYNVQGAFRKQNVSGAFERSCLEFIPDERQAQS